MDTIWWGLFVLVVALVVVPFMDAYFEWSDEPEGVGGALLMAYCWGGAMSLSVILTLWWVLVAALG